MVLRYWYLLRSSFPRLIELIYWPAVQMLMWGFLQSYIAEQASMFAKAGGILVGAVLLWDILFRGQLGFSVSFLEEMYARNLGNLLISPLRATEFVAALMIMSIIRLAIGMVPVTLLAIWFFGFNLWALGFALAAFFANLMLTSWAVGIFVSGLVLRNGLGAETFAWSIMFLFLPLTCVYYPVATLPSWLQAVAWTLPADIRIRRDARARDRPDVPRRPYDSGTCAESGAVFGGDLRVPRPARLGPPQRLAAADWRIIHQLGASFPIKSRPQWSSRVDDMTKTRHLAAVQKVGPGPDHMPIGEFGGAAALPGDGSPFLSAPMYWFYEMGQAALTPARAFADAGRIFYKNPANPFAHTAVGKAAAAAFELFERTTRRYSQPDWGIDSTLVGGERVPVHIVPKWERPFCRLLHFERALEHAPKRPQPKMLIVAPMSGHYATLLRGTVEAFLPNHDVYITEWVDARMVPLTEGRFDLDDYIDYVISMLHALNGDTHVVAVCQPSVPVLAAVARMEAADDPYAPLSMTLMGGPIDTRENPTVVNTLAEERGIEWFRRHVITKVPFPHPGFMRDVYPGFLQLNGFVTMNLDRHIEAHRNLFRHLVEGDGDSATKHREFYDEYLAVMDLSAEFYLQTVETVFIRHDLPKGQMTHRGKPVDPGKIRRVALLTIEGEHDDISGVGQTSAAHKLCTQHPGRQEGALPAAGRRPLRRVQRLALPLRDRAAHFRLHPVAQRSRKGRQAQGARRGVGG